MQVYMEKDGWVALVMISDGNTQDPFCHIMASVRSEREENAKIGADYVLNLFAQGREAFIRVAPVTERLTDFESAGAAIYCGFVRFSFRHRAGAWSYISAPAKQTIEFLGRLR